MEIRSAYVHVPFCRHRCGYCNFALIAGRTDLIPRYLEALGRELETTLPAVQQVDTLYVGGGTPSQLGPTNFRRFWKLLRRWLVPASAQAEITVELNPADVSKALLQVLVDAGVNRLSLGGQSFSDRKLKALERDHSGVQLQSAIELCQSYIRNVSLDLIFGVAEETDQEWAHDLEQALASQVTHLSAYSLTIEKGTSFYSRQLAGAVVDADEDGQLRFYRATIEGLSCSGWDHYEVSSFARAREFRSQHNESYWFGKPWWAFGPGAASFLPVPESDEYLRQTNHRSPTTYMKRLLAGQSPVAECDRLSREDYVRERLVFGLRRLEGIDLDELSALWGAPAGSLFEPYLDQYVQHGWMERVPPDRLRLTQAGLFVSDGLWPDLLGDG